MQSKIKIALLSIVITILALSAAAAKKKGAPMPDIKTVIEVPGATSDQLFVKANTAAVDVFVKADSVIEFSDKDAGVIKGKFFMHKVTVGGLIYDVEATITIELKEGKVRLSFTNISSTLLGDVFAGIHRKKYPATTIDKDSKLGILVKDELETLTKYFKQKLSETDEDW